MPRLSGSRNLAFGLFSGPVFKGEKFMRRALLKRTGELLRALVMRDISFEYQCIPIHVKKASYRKIMNWILVELSIVLRTKKPWGWPTFLQIEPTTKCNLNCSYCPVSLETGRPKGNADKKMVERLIDEIGDYTLILVLWGWGEPFVNPDVYDMIAYAKERGISAISSTNGHVFADRNQARRLVHSGIDALIVSTTGVTQDSFARFRKGNVDTSLQGVRNIVEEKQRQHSDTPRISLTLVVTQYNEHELEPAKEIAKSLGVDMLSLKKVNPCALYLEEEKSVEALPKDDRYKRFRYDSTGKKPLEVRNNPCKALWHKTNLRWDGRINSCTFDFEGASALGDFKKEKFKKIWRGESYRRMREKFRKDWRSIPMCSRCTFAYVGGNYTDVIAESFFFNKKSESETDLVHRG
jgi:radical SAM protein with 4Fe4S-binding SPASM domain